MRTLMFIFAFLVPSPLVAMSWDFAPKKAATTLDGVRPSAATGAGLILSPAPVVFNLAGSADLGTDAPVELAYADCSDGSCSVGPVRRAASGVARVVADRPRVRRLFGGRPVRSFLGRVFGGCGPGGCR